jgi:hypothetical protein
MKYRVNIREGELTVEANDPIDAIIKARARLQLMKMIPHLTNKGIDEAIESIRKKEEASK